MRQLATEGIADTIGWERLVAPIDDDFRVALARVRQVRSEEHTSELQSR